MTSGAEQQAFTAIWFVQRKESISPMQCAIWLKQIAYKLARPIQQLIIVQTQIPK